MPLAVVTTNRPKGPRAAQSRLSCLYPVVRCLRVEPLDFPLAPPIRYGSPTPYKGCERPLQAKRRAIV